MAGSPATPTDASTSPAMLAKAALKRLAEQRLEPTPDNFRKAYEAESGIVSPPEPATADKADPADEGERWSALITKILRGAERGGRQWTTARKKDSLNRVLEGSKSSATRLQQRLTQLVNSWDSDTLDSSLIEGDEGAAAPSEVEAVASSNASDRPAMASPVEAPVSPSSNEAWTQLAQATMDKLAQTVSSALPPHQATADEAAQALHDAVAQSKDNTSPDGQHEQIRKDLNQACEQARRLIDHRHHLIEQLTELCISLTESLSDLTEDDSWTQGQCQLMRHTLHEGLNNRGVRHVQNLLDETRDKQKALKQERDNARTALKQLIHQMLQEIAALAGTTDRFHDNLGRYAETIGQADSLESLAGVVREMVEESRTVQSVVSQTQSKLMAEHTRASQLNDRVKALEDEIRKLSDEVSTDPLTQIANRRGMMRAFEAEQAKIQRNGTVLALGLLDVDNFKKLNDTLGHQTGDEALKFLARRVSECLRPVDVVARYGGEEFVVMLPETDLEEAQQALTRLQRTLSAEFFTHEDKKVFITFSAGVTMYRPGEAIESTLERADVGLYEAKRTGKNRTCMN